MITCDGLRSDEILDRLPITYRQLNNWTATGRVKVAHYHLGKEIVTKGGSGRPGCYSPDQIKIIARVAKLLECGFDLQRSFELASDLGVFEQVMRELWYMEADFIEERARAQEARAL